MNLTHIPHVELSSLASSVGEELMGGRPCCNAVIDRIVADSHLSQSQLSELRKTLVSLRKRLLRVTYVFRRLKRGDVNDCIGENAWILDEEMGIPLESAASLLHIIWMASIASSDR